jgi:short-subunit dehydrogenase
VGVNAFSEALRQEVTGRHLRVGLIEPGAVETELASHNRPEVRDAIRQRFGEVERLQSEDIARAVLFMVTQPRHAAVNEILVRPTEQSRLRRSDRSHELVPRSLDRPVTRAEIIEDPEGRRSSAVKR